MINLQKSAIDKQFLIECLAKDLIEILMEERGYSMEKAMDVLYKSHTFEKIENEKTGLYYQSPVYVMGFLNDELNIDFNA